MCRQLQIPSLEAEGIYPRRAPALKDLQYKIKEVNMFIEVCVYLFAGIFQVYFWLSEFEICAVSVSVLSRCRPFVLCMSWAVHLLG